ncbi:ATP-binding cassette domain-containing protein [Nonomuraea ferruginea]
MSSRTRPCWLGTLKENLLFAAPDATEDELRRAIVRTRLDDLVARLPDGLDTAVGHRGVLLSGGERQRVAIARALLRKPRLLLLERGHLAARRGQRAAAARGHRRGCRRDDRAGHRPPAVDGDQRRPDRPHGERRRAGHRHP